MWLQWGYPNLPVLFTVGNSSKLAHLFTQKCFYMFLVINVIVFYQYVTFLRLHIFFSTIDLDHYWCKMHITC